MGACATTMREKSVEFFHSLNGKKNVDNKKPDDPAQQKTKVRKNIERIELTEAVVQEYISLEKSIYKLEQTNVLKKYESKMVFADDLKKTVDQLEATFKELKKQTEKERTDVDNIEQPSVKSFLTQQGTWKERFDKEQQEYLDALNQQEVAEKELKGSKMQYERAAKVADIYKRQCDQLNELYEKQDDMLVAIFGNDYASQKENQLEAELDDALEWQQRISLAKFKWTNGRVLLVHASTQMAFGITRWKELEHIDSTNTRMRYFAAAEARNNFIAAGQNIQSCRVYLGRVKFPYATEEEMALMEQTIHNSFNDIQSNTSLRKALNVYQTTHRKVASLIQWFDKVINETILKDLDKWNNIVSKKQKQLREERLELMKRNFVENTDEELLALEADQLKDEKELAGEDLTEILNLSQPEGRSPTPLSISQLAPLPSNDALFGDVRQRLTEYQSTREAIQKRNEQMKEKLELALQEKLKLRQQLNRRTRKQRRKSTVIPLNSKLTDVDKEIDSNRNIERVNEGVCRK
uniref:Uncharacterized protein n=1 Tax=Ditylenchus dipsaci TaxID=166011 RepID=A0A915DQ38_9BILA